MVRKSQQAKQDIQKGLLILRNTPVSCRKSPAQLFMESQLIGTLPKVYLHIHQEDHENLVVDQEKWNQISKMNARKTHAVSLTDILSS